jgi:ribosomal protein S9
MNQQMADKYMQILAFIERRYTSTLKQKTAGAKSLVIRKSGTIDNSAKPTEIEREFLDFLRIIIKGGWVVQDNLEWVSILEFVQVGEEVGRAGEQNQTRAFFREVARVYGFEEEFEQHFIRGDVDYK